MFGPEYTVQRQVPGVGAWLKAEEIHCPDAVWPALRYRLLPGMVYHQVIGPPYVDWTGAEPGRYRVVKELWIEGTDRIITFHSQGGFELSDPDADGETGGREGDR